MVVRDSESGYAQGREGAKRNQYCAAMNEGLGAIRIEGSSGVSQETDAPFVQFDLECGISPKMNKWRGGGGFTSAAHPVC